MDVRVKQSLFGIIGHKECLVGIPVDTGHLEGFLSVSTGGVTARYEGDYIVTPKVSAQILETKQKVMTDDLTIMEIPFFNVSNTSGGSTVYIGKEIE